MLNTAKDSTENEYKCRVHIIFLFSMVRNYSYCATRRLVIVNLSSACTELISAPIGKLKFENVYQSQPSIHLLRIIFYSCQPIWFFILVSFNCPKYGTFCILTLVCSWTCGFSYSCKIYIIIIKPIQITTHIHLF